MGIKQLTKLIQDTAGTAVKEIKIQELMGRTLAVDASNFIYQFLVAVRSSDGTGYSSMLTNDAGEVTSHLQGVFNRTVRIMEAGIRPVYVFDGKPPESKAAELAKRREMKEKAQKDLDAAKEAGAVEDMNRLARRTVHMTQQHQDDVKRLVALMGVPVVQAPYEAEAQCAALARAGKVWAAASEDMDTLTFDAPRLVRRLSVSEARQQPILQFDLAAALTTWGITRSQFVDLCILCGCDYTSTIRGIGPKKALAGIQKHGSLEAFMESLDTAKYPVPEDFDFEQARRLFLEHEVAPAGDFTFAWNDPDEDGIIKFLVDEKGFNADRVRSTIARLRKARQTGQQKRVDSFFTVLKPAGGAAAASAGSKRSAAKPAGRGGKAKRGR